MALANRGSPNDVTRRAFLKYAALGGLAAVGVYSGLRYPAGWDAWINYGRKAWEFAPGVVDYDKVLQLGWGPSELGFRNDIRNSPPSERVLDVAQWYDYWPGKVLLDFSKYMEARWGVSGVTISWTSNIYTSNEELFTWVTQTGRKFDLMFPTNYTVETLEKAGLVANLNKDWIPNYVNLFGLVPDPLPPARPDLQYQVAYPTDPSYQGYNNAAQVDFRNPALNGYQYRMDVGTYPNPRGTDNITWNEQNSLVAVPYQWGTTGIGYRTDVFDKTDIEQLGWDVFELDSYNGRSLIKKKMMLDDMREVFTAGLKATGWKTQVEFKSEGLTTADPTNIAKDTGPTQPTGSTPATYAESPFDGDFQRSSNETDNSKIQAASDWLSSFTGEMLGFNTPQQGPWLVSGTMYVDQAWSGDIMYAVRPNSNLHLPVDYFVPKQGGARWIDNAVIHRECERLWLAHEFINYILDPRAGAIISAWNLYASPNAWSFELLHNDPQYTFRGRNRDGSDYVWNHASDQRIYSDISLGYNGDPTITYAELGLPPILNRCEYQKDVGVRNTLNYFKHWRNVKY